MDKTGFKLEEHTPPVYENTKIDVQRQGGTVVLYKCQWCGTKFTTMEEFK